MTALLRRSRGQGESGSNSLLSLEQGITVIADSLNGAICACSPD